MRAPTEPLPDAALQWVAVAASGPRGRVIRHGPLSGGIASTVYEVIVAATGRPRRYVLRLVDDDGPHPAGALVRQEFTTLTALEGSDLPTPRVVAIDPEGTHCERSALLMAALPGRLNLWPLDPAPWLAQLAALLPRVHALRIDAPAYELWLAPAELAVPEWTSQPHLWRAAIDVARTPPPTGDRCFVHHDFQPFNVLWSRDGRLTGLLDWTWASSGGPPDGDVGHCRLNIAALRDPGSAEDFRRAYEAVAGRQVEPWWDVVSMLTFLYSDWPGVLQRQAGRRLRIDVAGAPGRVETVLAAALHRLG